MKVRELVETDEWTNNSITLSYLYKKQASACHHFEILAKKVEGINNGQYSGLSIKLEACNSRSIFVEKMQRDIHALRQEAAFLIEPFNVMVKAKEAFEKAGGKYPSQWLDK